jgi:stearoyl-CoA desaturase (delta-9 desaturase)
MLDFIASGLLPLPWWGYLTVGLIFTQLTILSVTIFLHRHQAHRALSLHPIISHAFRFWLWLATGIETKQWTAIHRKHHAKVETDEDPHSPVAKGIKKVFFEGYELYRLEAVNADTLTRYGEGTPNDWLERRLYSPHSSLGIVIMLIIDFLLFGMIGVTLWAIQMIWIPLFAAGVVNGIGHYWGYRNYEVSDASRNISPIGFFIGGEELHNNHHAFATSAKFSTKWWEFDMGWFVIAALQKLGLAHAKRVVPKPTLLPSKTHLDTDTLKAIITHRLQVMSRYTREVVIPLLRDERKRAGKAGAALLRSARVALIRDTALMKPTQKMRLSRILEQFQTLRVIYQLRIKLQSIWAHSTATQKELLEALQEWCHQAEATRLEPMLRFVQHLKTYAQQK